MVKSVKNNSIVSIAANNSFIGESERTLSNVEINVVVKSDRACTLYVDQSPNQVNWDDTTTFAYTPSDSKSFQVGVVHEYFRVRLLNGATSMGLLRLTSYLNEEYSALKITGSDGAGVVRNILIDETGKLQVSLTGTAGAPGKSAFDVAVDEGFAGTEAEWLASLAGTNGTNGTNGATGAQGIQGLQGPVGPQGPQGLQGIAGVNGTDGVDGLSAYQVWLVSNPGGSMSQYLDSIKGANIEVKGTMATAAMVTGLDVSTLSINDAWFAENTAQLYVWSGSAWVGSGSLKGEVGDEGPQGPEGPALNILGALPLESDLPAGAVARNTAYFVEENYDLKVATGAGTWVSSGGLRGDQGAQGVSFYFLGSKTSAEITAEFQSYGIQAPAYWGRVFLDSETYQLRSWSFDGETTSLPIRGAPGATGATGAPGAGILAKGQVALIADLTPLTATALQGDMYVVNEDKRMYVFNGVGFVASGDSIVGPQGVQGPQGSVGSVGLTGASIQLISTVNAAVDLPTGYDAGDIGKAHFISSLYTLAVWDGSAFVSSDSLQGPQGAQGIQGIQGIQGYSIDFLGNIADQSALDVLALTYGAGDQGKAYYNLANHTINVWSGSAWVASGYIKGEQGIQGAVGPQGIQGYSFQFVGNAASSLITGTIASGLGVTDIGKTYLGTDNYSLYFWNGSSFDTSFPIRGAAGVDGTDGLNGADGYNILAKGNVADSAALSAKVATAVVGDLWFRDDDFTANVFDGTAFQSSGTLRGPTGPAGANAALPTPSIVTYSVASGTDGGVASAGSAAWSIRPLNGLTNSSQNGGVSINANVITMASAGTYKFEFMGVVHAVGHHKVRLVRINNAVGTLGVGQNDNASNGNSGHSHNTISVAIAAGDQLRLEHWVENAAGAVDLGAAVSSGEQELYARVVIEKLF